MSGTERFRGGVLYIYKKKHARQTTTKQTFQTTSTPYNSNTYNNYNNQHSSTKCSACSCELTRPLELNYTS